MIVMTLMAFEHILMFALLRGNSPHGLTPIYRG